VKSTPLPIEQPDTLPAPAPTEPPPSAHTTLPEMTAVRWFDVDDEELAWTIEKGS
jgi:hypothetical protein